LLPPSLSLARPGPASYDLTSLFSCPATAVDSGTYCSVFDLTSTRQLSPSDRKLLHLVDVDELSGASSSTGGKYELVYDQIERLVEDGGFRCVLARLLAPLARRFH